MITKDCRLARASKSAMGGGGGASLGTGGTRTPSKEVPAITNWENRQINREKQFVTQDPLLGQAQTQTLDYNQNRLPQLLGQFPGFAQQLQGNQDMLSKWLGGGGGFGGGGAGSSWGPADTIANQGALSPGLARDASQQYRNISAASGNLQSPGDVGAELLNRDAAREQRYNTALSQGESLVGLQSGLTGQQAGLTGQEQALQTGGVNQLLGTGNAAVSQYTGLTNPILGYLSSLFSGNQQAAIAQMQADAQARAASSGKTSGAIGAGGSIIGAAIPVVAAAV